MQAFPAIIPYKETPSPSDILNLSVPEFILWVVHACLGLYILLILECKPLEDQDFDSTVDAIHQFLGQYLGTNI